MIFFAARSDAGRWDRLNGRPRAQQLQGAPALFVKGVTIDGVRASAHDGRAPVNAANTVIAGQFPLLSVQYDGARPNDYLEVWLVNRSGIRGREGQVIGTCKSDALEPRGTWTCQWKAMIEPGHYEFSLHLQSTEWIQLGDYFFSVGFLPGASR